MRLVSLIRRVDAVKPNSFSPEQKTEWINGLEGRVYTEVLLAPYYDFVPFAWHERWQYTAGADGLAAGTYKFTLRWHENGIAQSATYSFTLAAALVKGDVLSWDGSTLALIPAEGEHSTISCAVGTSGTELSFADKSDELFAGAPHDEIYPAYLMAQIDWHNGETNRYINSGEMFNSIWQSFVRYICYTYAPANALNSGR